MKIYLIERNVQKFKCLKDAFKHEDVELFNGDFKEFMKEKRVECIVSPANAYGLMDGGYDLAITEWFGNQLQERVQKHIIDDFYGEQPVGTSFIIDAGKDNQYLIHTPTMQAPQIIVDPRVIYHCMRSTLIEAKRNNIESILIPMFGGACGGVKPAVVAKMMLKAYKQIQNPPQKIGWDYVLDVELLPETDFTMDVEDYFKL